jgi:brefeldin A-inhibited guanine nucleotide-exchange protein
MTCDLEVRTRALRYLFEILKEHGPQYTPEFWDVVSRGVIFPIFDDLRLSRTEQRQFENRDDMTVWLNTTLIQALRQLVDLFSHSFENLEATMMDGVLDLIKVCFSVRQENETLAKIGSSCLQQLIENNAPKFRESHWDAVISTLEFLFDSTTANTLFDPEFVRDVLVRAEKLEGNGETGHLRNMSTESQRSDSEDNSNTNPRQTSSRQLKKDFQQIILKSVLQLLLIQTTFEIITANNPVPVYMYMRSKHLMRLVNRLEQSYASAKRFNADMNFRVALYRIGFMRQLPNLQKQETTAVLCLLSILYRMFADAFGNDTGAPPVAFEQLPFAFKEDRLAAARMIEDTLKSTSVDILTHFNSLEATQKQRNLTTWTPVVIRILKGLAEMSDEKFGEHCPPVFRLVINILDQHDVGGELKGAIYAVLVRTDDVWKISK